MLSGASSRGAAQPAKTEPGKDAASVACLKSTRANEDAGWRRFAAGWGVLSWEESPLLPLLLPSPAAPDDHRVGALALLARPVSQRRLAPGSLRMAAGRVVRLAAAVRVVDGVHRHATSLRAP